MSGKLTLQDAIDILDYASEGRTVSAKPDLLANEMNRRIARIIDAERDVARGQALREAAKHFPHTDLQNQLVCDCGQSVGSAGKWYQHILALSPDAIRRVEEHDQSTREKYRADLIAEGWIGPVQAERVAASLQRMTDLVRYARLFLHNEGLITDEEYASIVQDSEGRVARLEGYDAAIKQVAAEAILVEISQAATIAASRGEQATFKYLTERRDSIRADIEANRLAILPASRQEYDEPEDLPPPRESIGKSDTTRCTEGGHRLVQAVCMCQLHRELLTEHDYPSIWREFLSGQAEGKQP
jgi:hypothetical protein